MNCDHLLFFQNLDKITALRINDWTLQKGGVWLSFWQGCFGSPVITSDSGIPWFLGCMFFWAGSLNHESVARNDTFDEVRLVCEPCKWALFLGTKSSLIVKMEETKSFVEKDFGHPNSGTLTWNPKTGGLGRCFFLFLSEANSGSTLNFGVISHLPSSALEIRSSPKCPPWKTPIAQIRIANSLFVLRDPCEVSPAWTSGGGFFETKIISPKIIRKISQKAGAYFLFLFEDSSP